MYEALGSTLRRAELHSYNKLIDGDLISSSGDGVRLLCAAHSMLAAINEYDNSTR